ncbi:uncharacterized protein Nmag_3500 [Natrialba magadii ATCC 43099]|uniref:DUF7992 domain-containing protein n=1 Tax=Natrialba magadii (strain ATCC 43099 / DSM 3394 / CCM 3739 / CIP 104546 / IAM 13178 / JCM 8861 / NBRC 102185 / NCIMB 2190 / MS3) TaxID=547559 RepID=D3STI3_NATMM|nr:hypothetical protein [Natrialba magadii]ADD07050.1 uncharacterized protein Nmag_3500 [Natrialba magadii ATCC 43099]ELY28807.1 hypothetical protein C500_12715 [Natrialba magadii ATCC 43099]
MTLEVDTPAPPTLDFVDPNEYEDATISASGTEEIDYRREELQEFLETGAWEEAFDEWRADTDLDEREFSIARDLDLFADFDFFWDDFADRVGYHAPGISEDWQEREYHPELDTWGTVSAINAELTEFGQVVSVILKEEYIDWEAEYEPPEDLPDFD